MALVPNQIHNECESHKVRNSIKTGELDGPKQFYIGIAVTIHSNITTITAKLTTTTICKNTREGVNSFTDFLVPTITGADRLL